MGNEAGRFGAVSSATPRWTGAKDDGADVVSLGLRVTGVMLGLIGSLVAGLFMLLGPWATDPPPPNSSMMASYGYPLLMLFAGGAFVRSARAGFWLAVLALGCAIATVRPYVMDDSTPMVEAVAFSAIICLPALLLAVVAVLTMRAAARNRRPLMRR